MKTLLEKLLKFLGLLVLIIVVSLIPELIGGDIAAALKEKLGDHYYLTIGGVGLFTILAYTLWTEGYKIFKKKKGTNTTKSNLASPPILFFSFANDQNSRLELGKEERAIRNSLRHLDRRQEIKYHSIGQTNLDDVYDTFNDYHNQIYIFHYGGHSDSESLHLNELGTRSKPLATLLGQQPLKLVFLNGCANANQVKDLFNAGVPAVIATKAKVPDNTSLILAKQFYKALAGGKTIEQAFNTAVSYIEQRLNSSIEIAYRGIKLRNEENGSFPWGLYCQDERALNWRIEDAKATEAVSEDNLQKIRAGLLESYQERLKSKLAARFPINLELKYSTEGTNTRADIYDNKTIRSTKIKEELIELFDKHRGRLLIIGEPGAGKTTLLLQLAEQLMEREERQIPVVINMATWRERFSSVEEWLQELLPQIGFSKALATQFLQDDVLLPLFDGLDELSEDLRKPCLEAIGEYGKKQELRYVICSRIVEYAQTIDAPVYCQIMVKPLTLMQIREGLQEVNSPETNGILDAMKKDPLLREAIKTPFYLNTVQLLFATSKVWEEFEFKAETLEGRQQEIVEFFVADATGGFEKYSSEQVKKYLGFLADRMTWKGLVEFELVDLQYDWLQLKEEKLLEIRTKNRTLSFFLGGFFTSFFYFRNIEIDHKILVHFFLALVAGSVGFLFSVANSQPLLISTGENFKWKPKNLFKDKEILNSNKYIISFSIQAVAFSLFTAIRIHEFIFGLLIITSTILASVLLLFIGRLLNFTNYPFLKIKSPYQRFKKSLGFFNLSIFLHSHLRFKLFMKGFLPLKLIFLLNQATINSILESDGGSWRFRHRILQEYFAGHWGTVYGAEDAGHPTRTKSA